MAKKKVLPQQIVILLYHHKHGIDATAYKTLIEAKKIEKQIIKDNKEDFNDGEDWIEYVHTVLI
jgi:hypothetical protein